MTYLHSNCTKHGNYQYKEKYQPNCDDCFAELKKELRSRIEDFNKLNSELINVKYKLEKAEEILGRKIVDILLK